jgi:hypothetical protein
MAFWVVFQGVGSFFWRATGVERVRQGVRQPVWGLQSHIAKSGDLLAKQVEIGGKLEVIWGDSAGVLVTVDYICRGDFNWL